MSQQFVHLHSHTDHSPLDGHASVKLLAARVHEMGQPGFGITDHGKMSNTYNGWKAAEDFGMKFLPGVEAYVAPGDTDQTVHEPVFFGSGNRENKEERSNDVSGGGAYTHLTMLAETSEGMHNLFRLNTQASQKGNYKKNRMDIASIASMSSGIIATTGCPSGELQTRIRLGQWEEALAYAAKMQDIFGKDNYFLELMDHSMTIDLERKVRGDLMRVAKILNIPLLATNDLHYVDEGDAKDHEHLLCLQSGSSMSELPYDQGGKRFAFEGSEYYAKSVGDMIRLFPEEEYPGAISNTVRIAERASATFNYNPDLRPSVPLPEGHTEDSYLREQAYEGLARKRPEKVNDPEYIERLEKELEVFRVKNFSGYMLVVSDFMRWAKAQGWQTGPARGCLSADTNVLTSFGFKKINEIQVGDQVFDQLGNLATVPKTFEYDCDEELLAITSYYGGNPIKMTNDHKVLVSKADRELTRSQKSSGYKYGKKINPVEWIRADQVELGDFVVTPKINFPNTLVDFDIDTVSTRQINEVQEHSCRTIAKKLGLARSTVVKFMKSNGVVLGEKSQAIHDYMLENNVTIPEIVASRTITTVLPIDSKIPANSDMGKLIGIFLSDGWLRTRGTEIGFAQKRSEDDGTIPNLFKKIFGIEMTHADHTTADLRQYYSAHKGVIKLFRELFPDYEQTAHTKYLPAHLLHSSEEFRKGLLEGLWYGDGSHKGHTAYSTVSQKLAEGVFSLLISLGLQAGLKKDIRKKEMRPEFNKYDKETRVEYRVTSIREFDTTRILNGMGAAFDGEYMYQRVRSIETVPSEGKVYDFTMPTTNSYVTDSFVVHNSGGGSLLAFATDITEIDPIPHGLIFERFLNPERDSPPDIDSDFDDVNREKVIDYVRQKYGEETVSMIITFGMLKAKSAIKDVARILDQPYSVGENLTKVLPPAVSGVEVSLSQIFNKDDKRYIESEAFRSLANQPDNKRIVDAARGIEGKMKSTGVHAAGVIMSSKPLVDSIPLMMRKADGVMISEFDYPTCEALGLIKMDFLGIRNLTVIDKAIKAVHKNHGILLNSYEIYDSVLETHDEKTYDLLKKGQTLGVFQLDSPPIAALLKAIAPDKFGDLSATIALYRPGPMGMNSHNEYADRKNGRKPIIPIHPELEEPLQEILGETYGLCVAGDTLVWDAEHGKRVRIDSIKDRVSSGTFLTFGVGEDGAVTAKPVTAWYNTGVKEVFEVKTKQGYSLKLSKDHPVFTQDGWKRTEFLKAGDRISVPSTSFSPTIENTTLNINQARILGYLIGDGYITKKTNSFFSTNSDLMADMTHLVNIEFPDMFPTLRHYKDTIPRLDIQTSNSLQTKKSTNNLFNQWLSTLGYKEKTLSRNKFIPAQVFESDQKTIMNFVAALWDTDGNVNAEGAFYKTISKTLAYDLQHLLTRLGYMSTINVGKSYISAKYGETIPYSIHVYDPRFWDEISPLLVSEKKSSVIKNLVKYQVSRGFPADRLYQNMFNVIVNDTEYSSRSRAIIRKSGQVKFWAVATYLNWKFNAGIKINTRIETKNFIPYNKVIALYEENYATLADQEFLKTSWAIVKSNESVGEEPVYDITVGEIHNFLANGLRVMNCAYQEQVMQIAQKLAGYTMGEADNLRRAMGKKKKSVLDAEFPMFEAGMKKNGYSDDAIETIWNTLIPFAEYGFNKSHSAGYGLISYITAFLKANYPAEFMAANLSTLTSDKTKTALYLEDCRHMGLEVSAPSVAFSTADYTAVDANKILVGLGAIRGVGHDVAHAIAVEAEENGPYKSLDDFLTRAPVHALSKGVIEGLAHAGALDGFGYSRRTLKDYLPEAARGFVLAKKKESVGQFSLFDDEDGVADEDSVIGVILPDLPEYTKKDKLAFERHALGLYVSDHPLSGITRTLDKYADTKIVDILSGSVPVGQGFGDKKKVTLAGVVNSVTRKPTKKGEMFAMFTLEDVTGTIPCLMFPKTFQRLGDKIMTDSIYKMTGTLLQRDSEDDISFSVDQLEEIEVTDDGLIPYTLRLYENQVTDESMTALNSVIAAHPGDMPVYVHIISDQGMKVFKLDASKNIENNMLFHREVMMLFGTGAV